MKTIAYAMMTSNNLPAGQRKLRLALDGQPLELDILPGGRVKVPYECIRQAADHGFCLGYGELWPPRQCTMSPPSPFQSGSAIAFPDGTELVVPAPCHHAIDIPPQFVQHLESQGWVRLSQFA